MATLDPPPSTPSGGGGPRDLMLGIFLVQLAFFIVLVSLARPDFNRGKEVLANVSEVFGPRDERGDRPRRDALPTTGQEGEPVLREVGTFAGALFGGGAVAITGPGDELTLTVPLATLFGEDRGTVRPPGDRLFDALVAALGALPAGRSLRVTVAFAFEPSSEAATLARAGATARRLIARGFPSDAIAIGDGAPAGMARFSIRVDGAPPAAGTPASATAATPAVPPGPAAIVPGR